MCVYALEPSPKREPFPGSVDRFDPLGPHLKPDLALSDKSASKSGFLPSESRSVSG